MARRINDDKAGTVEKWLGRWACCKMYLLGILWLLLLSCIFSNIKCSLSSMTKDLSFIFSFPTSFTHCMRKYVQPPLSNMRMWFYFRISKTLQWRNVKLHVHNIHIIMVCSICIQSTMKWKHYHEKKLLTYLYLNYFCHINNEVVKVERVDY